jgi:hypothetical protein
MMTAFKMNCDKTILLLIRAPMNMVDTKRMKHLRRCALEQVSDYPDITDKKWKKARAECTLEKVRETCVEAFTVYAFNEHGLISGSYARRILMNGWG